MFTSVADVIRIAQLKYQAMMRNTAGKGDFTRRNTFSNLEEHF
jgi:hypothetical protein